MTVSTLGAPIGIRVEDITNAAPIAGMEPPLYRVICTGECCAEYDAKLITTAASRDELPAIYERFAAHQRQTVALFRTTEMIAAVCDALRVPAPARGARIGVRTSAGDLDHEGIPAALVAVAHGRHGVDLDALRGDVWQRMEDHGPRGVPGRAAAYDLLAQLAPGGGEFAETPWDLDTFLRERFAIYYRIVTTMSAVSEDEIIRREQAKGRQP